MASNNASIAECLFDACAYECHRYVNGTQAPSALNVSLCANPNNPMIENSFNSLTCNGSASDGLPGEQQ